MGIELRNINILSSTLPKKCENSSAVEHHLAKVGVAGSIPVFRSHAGGLPVSPRVRLHAEVAQLVELLPSKQVVAGSNPVFRSKLKIN